MTRIFLNKGGSLLTIGHLASALGLTQDLVKHYVGKGVAEPARNPFNGYRLFTADNAVDILNTKILREFSFRVTEARDLLSLPIGDQADHLRDRMVEIEAEIRRLELRKMRLEQVLRFTKQGEICDGRVLEADRPAIHSLYTIGPGQRSYEAERSIVPSWSARFPFTHISLSIPRDELSDTSFTGRHSVEFGLGVVEELCGITGLGPGPCVRTIPGGRHLMLYTTCPSLDAITGETTRPLREYAVSHGFRFTHNSSGRILASFGEGKERRFCILVRIRVEPADSH